MRVLFWCFCRLVGKGIKKNGILKHFRLKYLVLFVIALAIAHIVFGSAVSSPISEKVAEEVRKRDSLAPTVVARDTGKLDMQQSLRRLRRSRRVNDSLLSKQRRDTMGSVAPVVADTLTKGPLVADTTAVKPISQRDTTARKKGSPIEQIITGWVFLTAPSTESTLPYA